MPSKIDVGWLAGILDGEGCITLWLSPKNGFHTCRVTITNTDMGILDEVRRIYSEWQIFYTQRLVGVNGHKPCFYIEVNRKMECQFLLKQLLPYLKSDNKRARAKDFLQYVKTYQRRDGKKSSCKKREVRNSNLRL